MNSFKKILKLLHHIHIPKRKYCEKTINLNGGKFSDGFFFHKPGRNFENPNYLVTENTNLLLEEHVKRTGGQVRTRFPAEPNGLLHVGHAKAINLNFNYAMDNDGVCFLRYDDTNPTSLEDSFVRGIQEMVEWLGFKPLKITYASDYFSQLYEMAEKLIDKDLAYVCHEPLGAAKYRSSPWRFRNKSESLNVFREMKDGKYKEGEATLRLKMTTDDKIVDPVAYRIKHAYHHRTNKNWCIYPTYDYAHGLCDSLEDITHSFCPAEFSMKRSTYYWVCNAVGVYCPVQIEYGRLNFLNTVVSNRKITSLIKNGFVQGWDDPRLYTLAALRRRGYPPEVINEICSYFGFRRVNAYILPKPFHSYVRKHLENTAPRIMAVFNPLKILIVNYPWSERKELNVANVSRNKSSGFHTVTFDKEIWIEKSDFQEVPEEEFYRLTRDQYVGLKYTSHVIKVQEIVRKPCGSEIDHLRVECIPLKEVKKPRAYIHWVANPREAEARLYENLFKSERPDDEEKVPDGFLSDIDPNSLTVSKILVGETSIKNYKHYDRFQFERIGYFSVDIDTNDEKLVFNSILRLKQDPGFVSNV